MQEPTRLAFSSPATCHSTATVPSREVPSGFGIRHPSPLPSRRGGVGDGPMTSTVLGFRDQEPRSSRHGQARHPPFKPKAFRPFIVFLLQADSYARCLGRGRLHFGTTGRPHQSPNQLLPFWLGEPPTRILGILTIIALEQANGSHPKPERKIRSSLQNYVCLPGGPCIWWRNSDLRRPNQRNGRYAAAAWAPRAGRERG